MTHIQQRLQQRDLSFTPSQLSEIASKFAEDTAVILGKQVSREGMKYGYEKIILIVRDRMPKTIMYRRESQNFDKRHFQVEKIVYL